MTSSRFPLPAAVPIKSGAALLAVALLASCGGTGSSTRGTLSHNALVTFKFAGNGAQSALHRLQEKRRTMEHRSPKYVSLATNGIAIYVYPAGQSPGSKPTAVANVSSSSTLCTVDSDGSGDRVCTIPVTAPTGTDDFLVNGYDQPPSGGQVEGNELETGLASNVPITQGGSNSVSLTFDGIVQSVAVSPNWMTSQNDGIAHTYSFAINAYDADHYTIIDTVPFANALTVAIQNDPNKTLSVTAPGTGVNPSFYTLNYNGGIVNDGQIIAGATGITSTSQMDFTPMITVPTKLKIQSGSSGTFTVQMAVPAGVTPSGQEFIAEEPPSNCQLPSAENLDIPWTNGNPQTVTVSTTGGNNCTVNVIGPEALNGFALQSVQITISH